MKFHLVYPPTSSNGQSPVRVVEQTSGREVGWINRFLDREYVRRLADKTLRTYAHNLLHFVRWWESLHHTGDVVEADLAESTLLDYVKFQSSQLGLGRPRMATSRVRVKEARRTIIPLSVDEVARFWSSFHTARDLAIVGLMLLQGLRSVEVLALNPDDLLLSEAQVRVRGKGSKLRVLPLAPETIQLLSHYLRLERPNPCSAALFVSLKGRARGVRMTLAGFRSLFRYHRQTTGVTLANPHRFRHTFASDMVRAGVSLPALMQLMGHADIQTTMLYVQVTPQDVYREYARAVAQHIRPLPVTSS